MSWQNYHPFNPCRCYNEQNIEEPPNIKLVENGRIPENDDGRCRCAKNFSNISSPSQERQQWIDDQTQQTLTSLRQKACKFIKSDSEYVSNSESAFSQCKCRCGGNCMREVIRKAQNVIDYVPDSMFLRKMKDQYMQNTQPTYTDAPDFPSYLCERCFAQTSKIINMRRLDERENSRMRPLPYDADIYNQRRDAWDQQPARSGFLECFDSTGQRIILKDPQLGRRVRHYEGDVSGQRLIMKDDGDEIFANEDKVKKKRRSWRTKRPHRGRRKRKTRSADKSASHEYFEPSLKRPHENSCERCWRYASPSRSPVNKPEQRYDPNFRRAHSESEFGLRYEEERARDQEFGRRTPPPDRATPPPDRVTPPPDRATPPPDRTTPLPLRYTPSEKHETLERTPPPFRTAPHGSYSNGRSSGFEYFQYDQPTQTKVKEYLLTPIPSPSMQLQQATPTPPPAPTSSPVPVPTPDKDYLKVPRTSYSVRRNEIPRSQSPGYSGSSQRQRPRRYSPGASPRDNTYSTFNDLDTTVYKEIRPRPQTVATPSAARNRSMRSTETTDPSIFKENEMRNLRASKQSHLRHQSLNRSPRTQEITPMMNTAASPRRTEASDRCLESSLNSTVYPEFARPMTPQRVSPRQRHVGSHDHSKKGSRSQSPKYTHEHEKEIDSISLNPPSRHGTRSRENEIVTPRHTPHHVYASRSREADNVTPTPQPQPHQHHHHHHHRHHHASRAKSREGVAPGEHQQHVTSPRSRENDYVTHRTSRPRSRDTECVSPTPVSHHITSPRSRENERVGPSQTSHHVPSPRSRNIDHVSPTRTSHHRPSSRSRDVDHVSPARTSHHVSSPRSREVTRVSPTRRSHHVSSPRSKDINRVSPTRTSHRTSSPRSRDIDHVSPTRTSHRVSSSRSRDMERVSQSRAPHHASSSKSRDFERVSQTRAPHHVSSSRSRDFERVSQTRTPHHASSSKSRDFERVSPTQISQHISSPRSRDLERVSPTQIPHRVSSSRSRDFERVSPTQISQHISSPRSRDLERVSPTQIPHHVSSSRSRDFERVSPTQISQEISSPRSRDMERVSPTQISHRTSSARSRDGDRVSPTQVSRRRSSPRSRDVERGSPTQVSHRRTSVKSRDIERVSPTQVSHQISSPRSRDIERVSPTQISHQMSAPRSGDFERVSPTQISQHISPPRSRDFDNFAPNQTMSHLRARSASGQDRISQRVDSRPRSSTYDRASRRLPPQGPSGERVMSQQLAPPLDRQAFQSQPLERASLQPHPFKNCICGAQQSMGRMPDDYIPDIDQPMEGEVGQMCCHCRRREALNNFALQQSLQLSDIPSLQRNSYVYSPGALERNGSPIRYQSMERAFPQAYQDKVLPCPYKQAWNDNVPFKTYYCFNNSKGFAKKVENPAEGGKNPLYNPKQYCVFYMTKNKEDEGNEVEVLVEELTHRSTDSKKDLKGSKTTAVKDKMKRLMECQSDSMALRFQKGVSDSYRSPQGSRILYF